MDTTQRLGLPYIFSGQAQKEVSHNEALETLDLVVAAAVEEPPLAIPPASPSPGSCYLVASGASGAWTGKTDHIAAYTPSGLRFVAPVEGMRLLVKSTGVTAAYRSGSWEVGTVRAASLVIGGDQVVGARAAAIADPTDGAEVDVEVRAAVAAILGALRQHGLIAP